MSELKGDLLRRGEPAAWLYSPTWQRLPPTAPAAPSGRHGWLLLLDPAGWGEALAGRLEQSGQAVFRVRPGRRYARLGDRAFEVDPGDPRHFEVLLGDLPAPPAQVVHLWSAAAPAAALPAAAAAAGDAECEVRRQQLAHGLYGLFHLARALAERYPGAPQRLVVVASGLFEVIGDEALEPLAAPLLGPCRVLPQEHPEVACACFDLAPPAPGTRQEAVLVEQLLADLPAPPADVVAYRHGHRWQRGWTRLAVAPDAAARLRRRGVYLITGGCGRLGGAFAAHLARTVQARLVLLARRADGAAARHLAVELTALGAEVELAAADAGDEPALRRAVERAEARFGALHGVIHAAGVADPGGRRPATATGRTEIETQFRAKVTGTHALAAVLAGRELDFCMLTSSLAVLLGGLGVAAYSAANSFLDAFAWRESRRGATPWMAVDWDGLRLTEDLPRAGAAARGAVLAISPREAGEVLQALLAAPAAASQVAVSTVDLPARLAHAAAALAARRAAAEI